ncbi:autotransporter assembly complex family protein [Azoarcus sp. KH32C]|uniref:autotransporter assembly complex protein TamA n=1 Tax=Azoarcus sp. KH32C TaxID=748247 RepID=UPI00023868F8|nr:hypothetical protein AZKH_0866 [Azoarcus sp. KH32C]
MRLMHACLRPVVAILWLIAALAPLWPAMASAEEALRVELSAPDSVRPLLQQHLYVLSRQGAMLPSVEVDRVALASRTRREVADLLATEGYFSPQVKIERDDDKLWRVSVETGPASRVTAVEVAFEGAINEESPEFAERRKVLRAAWSLPVGQVFRQQSWDEAKRRLLEGVGARDFAAAHLADSRAEVDPQNNSVRLSVVVDSGPRFFLGPLEVTGLKHLPAGLVESYSSLHQGQPFDQEKLLALQTALQNVPQFASVIVDVERDPAFAAAAPVRVNVSEARSRQLGFGAGYSTNHGLRGEVSWRNVNFFNRAWELSSGLRLEQLRQSLYADVFLPPDPDGRRFSVGGAVERSDIEGLTVETQAVGVARTNTRGNIETRLALRVQQEMRQPAGGEASRRIATTLNWTWTRRHVDDVLDPRQGNVLQFQVGGGSRLLLSDRDFLRFYGRQVFYRTVSPNNVLILRAEGGITLAEERDGVPQDFLFRTGGTQTVRGYAFQSLGVKEGDAIVGGRYLGVASAEYVHWFGPQWGGATFVDAGDAADDRKSFGIKVGYGVGARWKSPAGPIALDVAYGQQERRVRLHFGVAIAF